MADDKAGLTAALEHCGIGGLKTDDGAQAEFFEPDTPLPISAVDRTGKPGRPPGAKNKRTEEMVAFLLARYRSPLLGCCELYSRSARDLAEELELWDRDSHGEMILDPSGKPRLRAGALMEVARFQATTMIAVLPYLHQKLPIALEVKGDKGGVLVMGDLYVPGEVDEMSLPVVEIGCSVEGQLENKARDEGADN